MAEDLAGKELSSTIVDDGVDSGLEEQGRIDKTDMYRMGKKQQFKV